MRSMWAAVPARRIATRRASVSGVATRVRAPTLDTRASRWPGPPREAAASRAPGHPYALPGGADVEPYPPAQPLARSGIPCSTRPAPELGMRASSRAVAASRWADSSAISSPSRSSWRWVGAWPARRMFEIPWRVLPSAWTTLHPGFRDSGTRTERAISRRQMIFGRHPAERVPMGPGGARSPHVTKAVAARGNSPPGVSSRKTSRP